jgi:dGTPase
MNRLYLKELLSLALLDKSKYKAQIEDIINLSVKNIYQSKEVIQKEVVGHRAISFLTELLYRSFSKKFRW